MRIDRVQIINFRSIQNEEVTFDPSCRVLVGINESGKSNILKALALMGSNFNPSKVNDLREPLPDEDPITESYVRFIFKFEKEDSDKLFNNVLTKIFTSDRNPEIVTEGTKKLKLKEFSDAKNETIYTVNILEENKAFTTWKLPDNVKLLEGWKKPKDTLPEDFTIELNGKPQNVKAYKLLRKEDFKDTHVEHFDDATIEDLSSLIRSEIIEITKSNLPDTLFWEYNEDNLLPNSITIADFAANPESCVPLKNMFALAGHTDINTSIENAKKGTNNQFQNYLTRIANQTTTHFREVWKEYRNIEFSLRLDADHIIPGIKEKNSYDFAKRSDGFKRFVTFLLLISVKVATDNMKNTLLLIDEPDISLHPSGARYLRNELIKISKKNYVIYSTHSIFMIDSGEIERHYIVKKKDEITTIESAQESNIADEEVLYNALGYSVFEILEDKNIIFEGWNDKKLFQVGLEKATADIKNKFKKVGICHGNGVKSMKTITPLMELANRQCLITSDSDQPAKEQQRLYKREKGYGEWKIYQDIDSTIEAITGEDFLKNDFITKQVKAAIASSGLPEFKETDLPDKKGKVEAIRKWLSNNGLAGDQIKDMLEKIKNLIFENLKQSVVEDTYMDLLKGIVTQYL